MPLEIGHQGIVRRKERSAPIRPKAFGLALEEDHVRGAQQLPGSPPEFRHQAIASIQIFYRPLDKIPPLRGVGQRSPGLGTRRLDPTVLFRQHFNQRLLFRQLLHQRQEFTQPGGALFVGQIGLRPPTEPRLLERQTARFTDKDGGRARERRRQRLFTHRIQHHHGGKARGRSTWHQMNPQTQHHPPGRQLPFPSIRERGVVGS